MDTQERAKWLKWSKSGLCLPLQTEESDVDSSERTLQNTLKKLLQRQDEMETNFTKYLREEHRNFRSKQCTTKKKNIDKSKDRKIDKKWLSF